MRLYLSSFRIGDRADLLVDLVRRHGGPPTVAVVANAIDEGDPARRHEAVAMELEQLAELGLDPEEVDLRDYEAASDLLGRDLAKFAGMWVRGGNVFMLRYAMAVSGADRLIPELLAADAFVYAGYSAGPCSLAPSLRGLEWCDDADAVWRLYGAEPIWDGLGVLDRAFVPHLETPGHPETELLGEVAAMYARLGAPYWGLRDGQVLVVDGALSTAVTL